MRYYYSHLDWSHEGVGFCSCRQLFLEINLMGMLKQVLEGGN